LVNSATVKTFILQFPEFQSLPLGDRQLMLAHNVKLFKQYFLGRYFFGGSGYQQQQV